LEENQATLFTPWAWAMQMEKEFQADDFCGLDYHLMIWGRKKD
jgi:hypothetical protein